MSRTRSFRGAVAAAAVVVCVIALAGCGGGSHASASDATLTIAINGEPQSLDPAKNGGDFQEIVQWLSYEPLIRLTSTGKFEPGLATSWKYVGNDNRSFEMTLRSGAKYADGSPVTADSVVKTIEYFKKTPGTLHSVIDDLSGVTATGPHQVRVTFSEPTSILPFVFSQMTNYGDMISPAGLANPKRLGTETFGAGAYTLDASATVSGDHYTFVKNKNYWDSSAQHYGKIVVKVISDPQTALNALKTGQIDVSTVTSQTQLSEAKSAGISVLTGKPLSMLVWLMDRDGRVSKAMGDVRVRQALNYAVDRPAIAKALGTAYAPLEQYLAPGAIGYDSSLNSTYAYDDAKAKQLLSEAGYPNGFSFALATNTDNRDADVAQILTQEWAKIGVTAKLKTYNNQPGEMFGALAAGKFSAIMFALNSDVTTQQALLTAKSVFNPFGLSSTAVGQKYAALSRASGSASTANARAINAALTSEAWFVPVVSIDSYVFANHVADLGQLASNGALDVLDWKPAS